MNLIAITGFFGAGKTTLLLALARFLCIEHGLRVVVLQNEIGEVGVDDRRLKAAEMEVSELLGGCICCELQGSLLVALSRIEEDYQPDIVLLEASGMATADGLRAILRGLDPQPDRLQVIGVLDAERLQRLEDEFSMPFVERTVEASDLLLYNKTAKVPRVRVAAFRERAAQVNPGILLTESADLPEAGLPPLLRMHFAPEAMAMRDSAVSGPAEEEALSLHEHHHHLGEADGLSASVCARQWVATTPLRFDFPEAAGFLERLSDALRNAGCRIIGHLKLLAEGPVDVYIAASVTAFDNEPETTGAWPAGSKLNILTINAIVYGLPATKLESLVVDALEGLGSADDPDG